MRLVKEPIVLFRLEGCRLAVGYLGLDPRIDVDL